MSNSTPQPVLIMNSVLAGLGVILGGAALTHYVPIDLVGLLMLVHAGVTLGWGMYVRGKVYPEEKVLVATPTVGGRPVATAALADRSVLNVGEPVDVTAQADPNWTGKPLP